MSEPVVLLDVDHRGVATVTIPGATVDGAPVGLSIMGARGSDAALVGLARVMSQQEEETK